MRQYFTLDNVRQGAFYVANKLYGLTFVERKDIPKYHPEVRTFEVKDADGSHLGVFLVDYHPRPGKRGGAWSSRYRGQCIEDGKDIRPDRGERLQLHAARRPASRRCCRSEEVETLFHEFGHGLHSLLSRVRYQSLAGVPRDFVELPSQIMENWALEPEVLKIYAKHYQTGAVIPDELVAEDREARRSSTRDSPPWSTWRPRSWTWTGTPSPAGQAQDAAGFEKASLDKIGMMPEIVVRYRSPYFQHIFAGAATRPATTATSGARCWTATPSRRSRRRACSTRPRRTAFRKKILEQGGTADAMEMYKSFRGREPSVEPLLEKRGLKYVERGARHHVPRFKTGERRAWRLVYCSWAAAASTLGAKRNTVSRRVTRKPSRTTPAAPAIISAPPACITWLKLAMKRPMPVESMCVTPPTSKISLRCPSAKSCPVSVSMRALSSPSMMRPATRTTTVPSSRVA